MQVETCMGLAREGKQYAMPVLVDSARRFGQAVESMATEEMRKKAPGKEVRVVEILDDWLVQHLDEDEISWEDASGEEGIPGKEAANERIFLSVDFVGAEQTALLSLRI